MSEIPLLPQAAEGSVLGGSSTPRGRRAVCNLASWWWALTTDEAYLRSMLSRRRVIGIVPPMVSCVFLFGDFVTWRVGVDVPWIRTDLALTLCTLLFVFLPLNTLWTDCFIATFYGCADAFWLSSLSAASLRTPYGYSLLPFLIFTQSAVGVHSTVVIAMAVASIVFTLGLDDTQSNVNHSWVVQSAGWSLVACCLTVAFELLTATSFHAFREQLTISSCLADQGFDGRLTVDVSAVRIRSASPGLESLLGPDVVGREPADFVHAQDREVVARLYLEAEENLGRSVMATYMQRAADGSTTAEFEGRLVGYHLADNCLRMILQVIGEVRVVETPPGALPELAAKRRREQQAANRALADRVWRSAAQSRGARQADAASTADSRAAVPGRQPQALASLLDVPER